MKKDAPEIEIFNKAGFTSIISGVHKGQGTAGKYIFFLNFYIELLYISDQTEALNNLGNFGCNYIKRSQWSQNKSSFLGLGLKMTSFDLMNIPFSYKEYKSSWMRGHGLYMATNNQNLDDPIVFILHPDMQFPNYDSVEEMLTDNKPDDFKENHIHDNSIKTLTSYKIITTSNSEMIKNLAENGPDWFLLLVNNQNQVCKLSFYPGSCAGEFSYFEVYQGSSSGFEGLIIKRIESDQFVTESGICLGLSKEELFEIKGKHYSKELSTENEIVYSFDPDSELHDFLKQNNSAGYIAKYKFADNKLVEFGFGHIYP